MDKKNKICIGILGGGQLARMSAIQAYELGLDIAIIEKEFNSPAGQLTKFEYTGWMDDENVIAEFCNKADVVTLENEFIESEKLRHIEEHYHKKVIPSSKTIGLIQDKFIQKTTLKNNNIPVPKFIEVTSKSSYEEIKEVLGERFLLKSRVMGYDGYGNASVSNENEFREAYGRLSKRSDKLMAEAFVDFDKELAVMIVRTSKEIDAYPVVETIQENHICKIIIAPAEVDESIIQKVKRMAIDCVKAVEGYGLFGIELFLTKKNKILINEMAPRPHNSGHYTIEGCITPQFENHIRAVLDLPLGSTKMIKKYAVMINLLGKKTEDDKMKIYNECLKHKDVHLHIYGKASSRLGRKMGHITIVGNDLNKILSKAKSIEEKINL
ncbi:MAG TPA: 5-(carboxyamino)imidazole ribonucleotide synthase [Ignavibacteriaceae bacterium]|nr:5-(carboxyamino)imidazole ribonucleotide synthase [Ignavibacteriaceae bacterium]